MQDEGKIRVVIDTNVFVSSFFGGNPRRIIDLWNKGNLTLCLSKVILDEYVRVFGRIGLLNEDEFEEILSLFSLRYNISFTNDTPDIKVIDQDPDDDKFIECAVALKAQVIVTGDNHILSLRQYADIEILSPYEFLKKYGRE